jgi:hypothetical protein
MYLIFATLCQAGYLSFERKFGRSLVGLEYTSITARGLTTLEPYGRWAQIT